MRTEAHIALIPKEHLDLPNMKNYHPISLLNEDYKIYVQILVNMLKMFLMEFIDKDQTSFLLNRQLRDNVRIMLNTIIIIKIPVKRPVGFLLMLRRPLII